MKYNGIELQEFTSCKPVVFDPPKKMLVWDEIMDTPLEAKVYSYMPAWRYPAGTSTQAFAHCAEIPEEPKPRRATNLELMKWLAQGKGYCNNILSSGVWATYEFDADIADKPCFESFRVRKWEDKEWHEPTADYMGLEG